MTSIEKVDEVTGLSRKIVIESRAADLRPRISIIDPETSEPMKIPGTDLDARYLLPVGANIVVPGDHQEAELPPLRSIGCNLQPPGLDARVLDEANSRPHHRFEPGARSAPACQPPSDRGK